MKKKFTVQDMHCTSCAMLIDGELEDLDGVKRAVTNYASCSCEVEFDENKVSHDDIIKTIKKVGYTAHDNAN